MIRKLCEECTSLMTGVNGALICDECQKPIWKVAICPKTMNNKFKMDIIKRDKNINNKREITIKEILDTMFENECACSYCKYDSKCPHDTKCYGGEPVETQCTMHSDNTEELSKMINYKAYAEENDINIK